MSLISGPKLQHTYHKYLNHTAIYGTQPSSRGHKGLQGVAYSPRLWLIGCWRHMLYQRQKVEIKSDKKVCRLTTCVKQQLKGAESELMPNTNVVCAGKCRREVVHTHNEQDSTLHKNDHTAAV
eukprot:722397-Pelagomonas_calceolata.AAC.1